MAESFLGEIKIVSFDYAPKYWVQCDGQLMSIAQNQALFSLLGTQFGGDGVTTFGIPDYRGRAAMHAGGTLGGGVGTKQGNAAETLTTAQVPPHFHDVFVSQFEGDTPSPTGALIAPVPASTPIFGSPANIVALNAVSVSTVGKGDAHPNMQPYVALNFLLCTAGIFPSRP